MDLIAAIDGRLAELRHARNLLAYDPPGPKVVRKTSPKAAVAGKKLPGRHHSPESIDRMRKAQQARWARYHSQQKRA